MLDDYAFPLESIVHISRSAYYHHSTGEVEMSLQVIIDYTVINKFEAEQTRVARICSRSELFIQLHTLL